MLLVVAVIWRLAKSIKVQEIRLYRGGLKGIESLIYLNGRDKIPPSKTN